MSDSDQKGERLTVAQLINLAEEHAGLSRYQSAEQWLRKATATDPKNPDVAARLGRVLAQQGRLDEARNVLEKAAKTGGRTNKFVLNNLGNVYLETGKPDVAIEYYERAIGVDPDYASAVHNLAVAYKRNGQLGRYLITLKRSMRLASRRRGGRRSRA